MFNHLVAAAALTAGVVAQTGSSFIATATVSFNASAGTTHLPNTDFSDEQLGFLWNQVGPVSTHSVVTTTVEPTPEPSFARPGIYHPFVSSAFQNLSSVQLPENFVWGLASSAYQVEGAVKDEGRGPSIWDLLAHRPPNTVADNTTGDVVGLHYYLYKQDYARLKDFGVPYFSPSISWPRIFPFGRGPVNAQGVKHYDDVIAELVKNGIKPVVTLFHWDTPLALFNEYNAWTNEQIVDDFVNYAKFIIERYDKYVSIWFTINEPQYCNWQFSLYPAGEYYPSYGVPAGLRARFLCGHYTLLAHAKIAKWYHEEFKGSGRISFKNSGNYYEPLTNSSADIIATQRNFDFALGWFAGPWTDGDYPESLKTTLGDLLPTFTEEEKELIKGSCDFYAIDGYTAFYGQGISDFEACVSNSSASGFPECAGSVQIAQDGFPLGPSADPGANWLKDTPTGIRKFLNKLTKSLYPAITDIVVSEFGFAEPFESKFGDVTDALWDLRRADYFQGFLDNILLAITEDKVNCTGAFGWAIFDNFEWFSGKDTRFGLQFVDYDTLQRTPKASMFQFLNWFKQHGGNFNDGGNGGNGTSSGNWTRRGLGVMPLPLE